MNNEVRLFAFENGISKHILDVYIESRFSEYTVPVESLRKCFDANSDDVCKKIAPRGCAPYSEIFENSFEHASDL